MFKILPVEQTPYQNTLDEKKQWEQEKQELLLKIKKMEQQQVIYSPEQPKKQQQTTKLGYASKESTKTKYEWNEEGDQHWYASRYA